MEEIQLEITNWDKHNPRKDVKHPSWFALSNRFLEDPEFFDFTPIQLKAILYIWCQASQKNSANITIRFAHAKRVCDIDSKSILLVVQALEKLGHLKSRTESVRGAYVDVQNPYATNRQTNRTEQTEQDTVAVNFVSPTPVVVDASPPDVFSNLSFKTKERLDALYPDREFVFRESVKMQIWLEANRSKSPKSVRGWSKFVMGWLERGWENYRKTMQSSGVKTDDLAEWAKSMRVVE